MNWYKKSKAETLNLDDLPIIDDGGEDDPDIERAKKYFNIGHGDYVEEFGYNPDYQIWIMLYGEVQKSKVFKVDPEKGDAPDAKTHRMLWGDLEDTNYKGRYEPQTGRLTIVKPDFSRFRDIPHEVMNKIKWAFPRAKKIIVAKNTSWYKKAQAMFETFGLDEKIVNSFSRHFNDYIKQQGIKKAQKELNSNTAIVLGYAIITESLKPIIEKYGVTKALPKRIAFVIVNNKNKLVSQTPEKTTKAFFDMDEYNFIIGMVLDNLNDFYKQNEWKYYISHEIQHFIKSLYEGKGNLDTYHKHMEKSPETHLEQYFSNPWEIQSYSLDIAKKAVDLIKDLFTIRTRNMTPQNSKNILLSLNSSRNSLISKYLNAELKNFIKDVGKKTNVNEDTRRKYYEATIKNFNRFLDKWVEEKSNELV